MSRAVQTCSSLRDYVEAAQKALGTSYLVLVIDRIYHVEPGQLIRHGDVF